MSQAGAPVIVPAGWPQGLGCLLPQAVLREPGLRRGGHLRTTRQRFHSSFKELPEKAKQELENGCHGRPAGSTKEGSTDYRPEGSGPGGWRGQAWLAERPWGFQRTGSGPLDITALTLQE